MSKIFIYIHNPDEKEVDLSIRLKPHSPSYHKSTKNLKKLLFYLFKLILLTFLAGLLQAC
ncbi:MAG TPA: hypothetical protein VD996_06035 [Chitinophagaceae bacterium]|nr:hypothetical protein [Chitinophagaceae bacterium]